MHEEEMNKGRFTMKINSSTTLMRMNNKFAPGGERRAKLRNGEHVSNAFRTHGTFDGSVQENSSLDKWLSVVFLY